jgi:hypothetical protein
MNLLEALIESDLGILQLTSGDVVLMSEYLQAGPVYTLWLYDKPILPEMMPTTNPTTPPVYVESIGAVLAALVHTGRREIAFGNNWRRFSYGSPVFRIDPHQNN